MKRSPSAWARTSISGGSFGSCAQYAMCAPRRMATVPASASKPVGAPVVTAEQAEIARLRAENARLKMERDIAKKAAAYFAQDVLQGTPGSNR